MNKLCEYNNKSDVEKVLNQSFRSLFKIKVFQANDFSDLGKITALRFIEWLQLNPKGVISLPTGKTPEFFIKWTSYFLNNWNEKEVQKELEKWKIKIDKKPKLSDYTFVQIDEFYPMNPQNQNSFAYYIDNFYFKQFGLDPKKALLLNTWSVGFDDLGQIFGDDKVDLTLRFREPKNEKESLQRDAIFAMDQYAMEYEEKIKKLGGIGFFLGGIGPDGHIAFNIKGSDHFSTTRLLDINYPTAAAAAGDFGGIECARKKVVVTIGLNTIVQNPTTTAIIIAAGEGKAKVVADAVKNEPSILYPATVLQKLEDGRFYITTGAAKFLKETKIEPLNKVEVKRKIENGLNDFTGSLFLHTSPHHDDVMLSYFTLMLRLATIGKTSHYFATMTSGFNSVKNKFILQQIQNAQDYLQQVITEKLFLKNRDEIILQYLDGIAKEDKEQQNKFWACRMLTDLAQLFELDLKKNIEKLKEKIEELKKYFVQACSGQKDTSVIQTFKGMIREWEEEILWAHLGFYSKDIFHLRLGFYKGDIFTQQPDLDRDVKPILNLLNKINPDILTVAMDPQGSGPDTHYKVLQAIKQAVKIYKQNNPKKNLTIWGYRNVWNSFEADYANIFIPVSINDFSAMKNAFNVCFGSQRSASFPSAKFDGPFCDLAQKIMVEQYFKLKECLGDDYFYKNLSHLLRAAKGFCFLKVMSVDQFLNELI